MARNTTIILAPFALIANSHADNTNHSLQMIPANNYFHFPMGAPSKS